MPANYVLLEKITVGAAGASSVTFSGIPQTGYTDLVVKLSARTNRSAIEEAIFVEFNGSGGTAYSSRRLYGTGSVAASDSGSSQSSAVFYSVNGGTSTGSTFGSAELYIPNYTSSSNKSFSVDAITENNATAVTTGLAAALWANTSAITSIKLTPASSGTYLEGSTFYLYGVAKLGTTPAIVPYATGGDTIMTDGTYWYHTFLSSGTFTPQKSLSCDYLVVAGAGGGGGWLGGGGGAGGLRSTVTATGGGGTLESALILSPSVSYTVTVGAGGSGGPYATPSQGTNGSNSVFSTITSTGGGGGGGFGATTSIVTNGSAGGSGGGGGGAAGSTTSGGTGTANQGYAGGTSNSPSAYGAGGGGGAGAVGGNSGATTTGGAGGNGVATSISGSSVTYGGGGGGHGQPTGGAGGAGGGGAGVSGYTGNPGVSGTANTGGGGGGGRDAAGGNGGSGIVIVRYAV